MSEENRWVDEFKQLRPADHQFAGVYEVLPFNGWFWAGWYDAELAQEIGLDVSNPSYVVLRNGYVYPSKATYAGCSRFIAEHLADGVGFSKQVRNKLDAEVAALSDFLQKAESTDVAEAIGGVARWLRRITFYWAVGYFTGVEFESYVRDEALERGLPTESLADHINRADTHVVRRQAELQRLKTLLPRGGIGSDTDIDYVLGQIEQSDDLRVALERHLESYDWIGMTGFMGEPLAMRGLVEELLITEDKVLHKAGRHSLGHIGEIATNLQYLNQVGAEYFQIFGRRSIPLLEKAASIIGGTRQDLMYLTPEEVADGVASSAGARDKIERRKRIETAFCLGSDGLTHLIEDADAIRAVRQAFEAGQSVGSVKEVVGTCGSRGNARGPARVVMGVSDFHKLQKGDVLFTSMTTPDFVPLMQRASAIVTDMGGLLSHAVIMSRELGKPCVIGTKVATQIFKDGDIVEVDAERGIIRKL